MVDEAAESAQLVARVDDITPAGLNFVCLESGVCVEITEEDQLEVWSYLHPSRPRKQVASIGNDMRLVHHKGGVGGTVCLRAEDEVKRRPPPRPEELPQSLAREDARRHVRAWAEDNGCVELLDEEPAEFGDPRLRALRDATLELVEARADYERAEADATEAIAKYEIALAAAQEAVEIQQRAVARWEAAQEAHLAAFRASRHLALSIGHAAFAEIAGLDGQLSDEDE